jgi:hypothetical protein
MQGDTLIVIAHYAARSRVYLDDLIKKLSSLSIDFIVVINDDNVREDQIFIEDSIKYIKRQNTGMNIAAWYTAYSLFSNYEFYIFLQDECFIKDDNFISSYLSMLSIPDIGLVGESINPKWDRSWIDIANSNLNYSLTSGGNSSITRVDYYLSQLKKWSINSGYSGRHMRALIWAFRKSVLDAMPPFPIGTNKEECIAAEIAISKQIESMGLKVSQTSNIPFSLIGHYEWRSDGIGKK